MYNTSRKQHLQFYAMSNKVECFSYTLILYFDFVLPHELHGSALARTLSIAYDLLITHRVQ